MWFKDKTNKKSFIEIEKPYNVFKQIDVAYNCMISKILLLWFNLFLSLWFYILIND